MTHEFHQDSIDKFVATLSNSEIYQIILDHDELERKGKIGDCLLRSTTERWIETVPYPGISFVIYMGYIANACHKRRSLQLLQIEGAVTAYHLALDMREHGGTAGNRLIDKVQTILDQPWRQGVALAAVNAMKEFDAPTNPTAET